MSNLVVKKMACGVLTALRQGRSYRLFTRVLNVVTTHVVKHMKIVFLLEPFLIIPRLSLYYLSPGKPG